MPGPKHTSIRIERDLDAALKPFIISAALPKILALLQQDAVRLAFSTRKSRVLGYYCPPKHKARSEADYLHGFDSLHTISLQVDLNPYALLFVLIHEWAHLITRKEYGNEVYPHGREWKENFKRLFPPFHSTSIFPADILHVIDEYFMKTSPYFESRLEDACHRYGKDRKAFFKTYMNLLRQGIVIPAPYMGIQTTKDRTGRNKGKPENRFHATGTSGRKKTPACRNRIIPGNGYRRGTARTHHDKG